MHLFMEAQVRMIAPVKQIPLCTYVACTSWPGTSRNLSLHGLLMSLLPTLIFCTLMEKTSERRAWHYLWRTGGFFFKNHGLSLDKIDLIVTDGSPAICQRKQGSGAFKKNVPETTTLYCIIHQSLLCVKLSGELNGDGKKTKQ